MRFTLLVFPPESVVATSGSGVQDEPLNVALTPTLPTAMQKLVVGQDTLLSPFEFDPPSPEDKLPEVQLVAEPVKANESP
jgi:hypothetical protein